MTHYTSYKPKAISTWQLALTAWRLASGIGLSLVSGHDFSRAEKRA